VAGLPIIIARVYFFGALLGDDLLMKLLVVSELVMLNRFFVLFIYSSRR
jgi:hypothetical protein